MEERMGRLSTRTWTLIGGGSLAVALLAPATAPAQVTIDGYRITSDLPAVADASEPHGPSTFQAGANPDAGSWSRFTYPQRDRGPRDRAHQLRRRAARQPRVRAEVL